jgi:hypothetical protein
MLTELDRLSYWFNGQPADVRLNWELATLAALCFLAALDVRLWRAAVRPRRAVRQPKPAAELPHRAVWVPRERPTVRLPRVQRDPVAFAPTAHLSPLPTADVALDWAGADEHWSPRAALAAAGPGVLDGVPESAPEMGSRGDDLAVRHDLRAAMVPVLDDFNNAFCDVARRWPWLLDEPEYVAACVPAGSFTEEIRRILTDAELVPC